MRILVAGGMNNTAGQIKKLLEGSRYTVQLADSEEKALAEIGLGGVDCILAALPAHGADGLTLLHRLREEGFDLPVVILSEASTTADCVAALDAGADDYLVMPFEDAELLARIRAVLRRARPYIPEKIGFGDIQLDPTTYDLVCCAERNRLNNKEYQVIEGFLRSPQEILSTDALKERYWGSDSRAEINVVWTNIANLRCKLRKIGSKVTIRSFRGVGYRLEIAED